MTAVEKLIAKYEKQWDKYGMGSVISYSQVVSDLEKLKKKEEEQIGYSEEDVREMLLMALYEPQEECCATHTKDSIVRKVLKTFKSE